ncbi:hypothetical protein BKA70DRAFT_479373 [Coprinopsis sp. MPI-PUGE-AT-0042]|nr:hypothetical protein BKA70DRAFT_479373 [Coprinopsis sp. MPI-PUGE-AT-0042]
MEQSVSLFKNRLRSGAHTRKYSQAQIDYDSICHCVLYCVQAWRKGDNQGLKTGHPALSKSPLKSSCERGKEVTHFHEQSFEELQEYQGRKRQEFEERLRGGQGKVEEWIDYGSWEVSQNNLARSRSVFERALDVDTHSVAQQPCIPEILWKAYIDLELGHGDREAVRRLYERLVQLSPNAKVWMSYALFEAQEKVDDDDKDKDVVQGDVPLARAIFRRGVDTLEGPDRRLQRLELLGAWEAFEEAHGPHEELEKVREKATSEHSARVSDGGEGMDPAGLKLLQDAQLCPTSES